MPDTTSLGWIVSHFGIALLALILLDRSHRDAHKKLEEVYKAHMEDKERLLESLRRNLALLDDQLAVERGHKAYEHG